MPAVPPVYTLYGEKQWPTPDMVHCESIAARSRLHDWEIRPHRHHGLIQWLYLQSGQAQVSLDGQRRKVATGHVITVPSMTAHGFQFAPDACGYVVTLGHPLLARLQHSLADGETSPVPLPEQPRVLPVKSGQRAWLDALFACLHDEYQSTRKHRNRLIDTTLTSLMVWIGRQLADEAAHGGEKTHRTAATTARQPQLHHPPSRHFERFNQLLEQHYHEPWPVARYAAHTGITPAHLNVLCRASVGQSAQALIHQRRLLEARRMLVYTSMRINTIADALGFHDPAYFTRFFRRLTGQPPRAFRTQAAALLSA